MIVPADSIDALRGATLDLPSDRRPGRASCCATPTGPTRCRGAHLELTGTTDEKVRQLLDQQINPSLATHGGFAALDRVEGEVVYVTMGGGCQGCAVSAMTLREGIARSIKEAIPEVTEVVDMTDHEHGENPYYT